MMNSIYKLLYRKNTSGFDVKITQERVKWFIDETVSLNFGQ